MNYFVTATNIPSRKRVTEYVRRRARFIRPQVVFHRLCSTPSCSAAESRGSARELTDQMGGDARRALAQRLDGRGRVVSAEHGRTGHEAVHAGLGGRLNGVGVDPAV